VPIVLHGGSGVPFESVQAAIARGVAKVNVGTELQRSFSRTLRETLSAHPNEWDARKLIAPSIKALEVIVRERIEVFGSASRA
jgi:fructose-bisphosphate aldolase class II